MLFAVSIYFGLVLLRGMINASQHSVQNATQPEASRYETEYSKSYINSLKKAGENLWILRSRRNNEDEEKELQIRTEIAKMRDAGNLSDITGVSPQSSCKSANDKVISPNNAETPTGGQRETPTTSHRRVSSTCSTNSKRSDECVRRPPISTGASGSVGLRSAKRTPICSPSGRVSPGPNSGSVGSHREKSPPIGSPGGRASPGPNSEPVGLPRAKSTPIGSPSGRPSPGHIPVGVSPTATPAKKVDYIGTSSGRLLKVSSSGRAESRGSQAAAADNNRTPSYRTARNQSEASDRSARSPHRNHGTMSDADENTIVIDFGSAFEIQESPVNHFGNIIDNDEIIAIKSDNKAESPKPFRQSIKETKFDSPFNESNSSKKLEKKGSRKSVGDRNNSPDVVQSGICRNSPNQRNSQSRANSPTAPVQDVGENAEAKQRATKSRWSNIRSKKAILKGRIPEELFLQILSLIHVIGISGMFLKLVYKNIPYNNN